MPETRSRMRNTALLVKIQGAAGSWSTPGVNDAVLVEDPSISWEPTMIQTNEVNPSLDSRAPLVGGIKVALSGRFYLKGSGSPGVEAEWDPLARVAGMARTITKTDITGTDISFNGSTGKILAASSDISPLTVGTVLYTTGAANTANTGEFVVTATGSGEVTVTRSSGAAHGLTTESAGASVTITYGVAAVAATAGAATTFTAQSPHSNTAQAYQFLPAFLSGNPATPVFTHVLDYTSGRVGTVSETFSPVLSSSTKVSYPASVVYTLASDSLPWASAALYGDGKLWQMMDLVADSLSFGWTPNGTAVVDFTLRGKMYAAESDAAVPAAVYDTTRPGVFINSKFTLDRTAVAVNALTFGIANTVAFPDNPNEAEGCDAPIITARTATVNMEPNMTTVATRDTYGKWRAGTQMPVHSRLTGGFAANPGQRIMQTAPAAFITARAVGNKDGMRTEQLSNFADGFDSGFGLAIF